MDAVGYYPVVTKGELMRPKPERVEARVRDSPTFSWLVRGGLTGYGLLHLLVAWVTLGVLERRGSSTNSEGALAQLSHRGIGLTALLVLSAGFVVLALWQATASAVGYRQLAGRRRLLMRLGAVCRAGTYGYLAFSVGRVIITRHAASGSSPRSASAGLLAHPLGRLALGGAGIVITTIGIGLCVFGLRREFLDQLDEHARTSRRRVPIVLLGQIGYVAKGVAFAVMGLLVCWAAITDNAQNAGGLDQSLERVVGAPVGAAAVVVIGIGIGCFGFYLLARARHLHERTLTS